MEGQVVTLAILEAGQLLGDAGTTSLQTDLDGYIEHDHEIRLQAAGDPLLDGGQDLEIDAAAVALIGHRRGRIAVTDDDIATLKVFAAMLLLPLLYIVIAIAVGVNFGFWWGLLVLIGLPFSFFASVRLMEAEAGLFTSMQSLLRLTRLGSELDELRTMRAELVSTVRQVAERLADPDMPRMFTERDFGAPESKRSK